MNHQDEIDAAVAELGLERLHPSDAALFRAGKAFKKYRDINKGKKTGVLPDFIVGAMVETLGIPLLTADKDDFEKYFSGITIIAPY